MRNKGNYDKVARKNEKAKEEEEEEEEEREGREEKERIERERKGNRAAWKRRGGGVRESVNS